MRYLIFAIGFIILGSCDSKEEKSYLEGRISQLEQKLKDLEEKSVSDDQKDTLLQPETDRPNKNESVMKKPTENKNTLEIQKKKEDKRSSSKVPDPSKDTTFHYYVNGKVSVKIHPWKDGRRKIELFDLYGKRTYETEDTRLSYSRSNHFSFHANGGVHKIRESFNPGASMYMYENVMEFSTVNEPLVMYKSQWPATLEETMESQIPWFWNKRTGNWEKQEVIYEQETPQDRMR